MEADWSRLRSIAVTPAEGQKIRQWFVCEVPDEDETSGDDDWLHVADVLITVELGVVTQVEIWAGSPTDEIFEADAHNGRLEEVIVELLRSNDELQFALDVPLFRATMGREPMFIYHSDLRVLA